VRAEIADAWSLYHSADFGQLLTLLPEIVNEARLLASVGTPEQKAAGSAALGKALQLAGHLAIRLGKPTWRCLLWSVPRLRLTTPATRCSRR
jgi:hypothetical protein